jgi:hypothetical protein
MPHDASGREVVDEPATAVAGFLIEFSTDNLAAESPAAYFDGVSQVIDAFQSADANLLAFLLPSSRTGLRIDRLEIGSFRIWLATQLEDLPEEGLRKFDWKQLVGHYLLKCRNAIVKFLRKNPKVEDTQLVERLGAEIDAIANDAIPATRRFSRRLLLGVLVRVIRATQSVPGAETVHVIISEERTLLPREAEVTIGVVSAIESGELEPFEQEMRLLVKKPDMLGRSQWEFVDRGHVIRAKMGDLAWVERYQRHGVVLNPGDAIDVRMQLTPKHTTEDQLYYTYSIVNVRSVIPSVVIQQPLLFESAGDSAPEPNDRGP